MWITLNYIYNKIRYWILYRNEDDIYNMWDKIVKLWNETVIWYVYDKPRDIYKTIRHWFYCNWNREHWLLVKQAFCSYGWDGSFITMPEEKQIDKQLKWFSEHQMMVDEQYNEIMRSLKWAKYLVHIINTDADDFWGYTGKIEWNDTKPVGDSKNIGTIEADTSNLIYHYYGPKINHKNLHRYLTKYQLENEYFMSGNCEHEIYLIKCKRLYYKIREKYTDYWWD